MKKSCAGRAFGPSSTGHRSTPSSGHTWRSTWRRTAAIAPSRTSLPSPRTPTAAQELADAHGLGRISIATKTFVDTNILVYAVDDNEPRKRDIAREVLANLRTTPFISTQVLVESYSAMTRKLGIAPDVAADIVTSLSHFDVIPTHTQLVLAAVETSRRTQYSIWDALIIEAAVAADCQEILTEDLHDGSHVHGIRIVNPFADAD